MTTINAEVQTTGRVVVTVAGIPVDAVEVEVLRDYIEGRSPLRGLVHAPGTTAYVLVDHEAPLERPVYYAARVTDPAGVVTETITAAALTVPAPVGDSGALLPLVSSPITGEAAEVTLEQWAELSRTSRGSVIVVAGRTAPVVVSDILAAPSSAPVLRTDTRQARAALARLLASGQTLLVRSPAPEVEDTYLSVVEWTEARVTNSGTDVRRRHTLAVQEVDPPGPELAAVGDSLLDLSEAVPTTLLDLSTTWPTLLDVAAADLGAL